MDVKASTNVVSCENSGDERTTKLKKFKLKKKTRKHSTQTSAKQLQTLEKDEGLMF